jgi:hypothetical protein
MTLADAQQQRVLDRLRQAGDQPVAFEGRVHGQSPDVIKAPGACVGIRGGYAQGVRSCTDARRLEHANIV